MSRKILFASVVMVVVLAAPAVYAEHHEAEYEKLPAAWQAAYNAGDAAALAAMYLEDGVRMPPDMPVVEGREAIQAQVQAGMDQGLVKVSIEMVESTVAGEIGLARGTFKLMGADGNVITVGKWANVSKLVDGKWMVRFDIFNHDAPLAMPMPE